MTRIPRDGRLDSTRAFLAEGYPFILNRSRRLGSDIFRTRLMLRQAVCLTGPEAAREFYRPGRFTRKGAMPPTTLMLLQDRGSVQTLDDLEHLHRKQMFLSLLDPGSIAQMVRYFEEQWRARLRQWEQAERVVLQEEVEGILCRAACRWVGISISEKDARRRTREFAAMIDGAGAFGPRTWRGLRRRSRTERWARRLVRDARAGELTLPEGRAAQVASFHVARDGKLLPAKIAAVEVLNILRPTVAISRYVTFAALALHEHPECRDRLRSGEEGYAELFAQEVRRFYPFFPAVAGKVREEFEWRGHRFRRGDWVLLDLYGTNRDPRAWPEPDEFRPDRFRQWDGSPFNFVPQGGGDDRLGHRCPGERLTIEVLKRAVMLLTTAMQYEVPEQDLSIDLSRLPAIPQSRFAMAQVRRI